MSKENPTPEELARSKARRNMVLKYVFFAAAAAVILAFVNNGGHL